MRQRPFPSLLLFLAAFALCIAPVGPAAAEEDVATLLGLQVRNRVEHGKQRPAVLITPKRAVKSITLKLRPVDGEKTTTVHQGAVRRGGSAALEFPQGEGSQAWVAELGGVWKGGRKFSFAFKFESTALAPLRIDVTKKDVDLDQRTLEMRFSRGVQRVEYAVTGGGGRVLDQGRKSVDGQRKVTVRWSAGEEIIEKIEVKAWDSAEFWAGVEITPFEVALPHDEVEFEFGEHEIPPGEEHKLAATLDRLHEVLDKHGREIEIQLYIAGYTDTVGSPSSNLELSRRRAKSIAAWFRKKGVKAPIFYVGYGESHLAVPTPDETREARNRRAVYVLSAGPPSGLPAGDWKKL